MEKGQTERLAPDGALGTEDDGPFNAALCAAAGLLKGRAVMLADDPTLADDLVQTVFERALRARHRPPLNEIQPWLTRILKNAAIDHWRSAAVRQSCELDTNQASETKPDDPRPWWYEVEPDVLTRAAHQLPLTFRKLFLLRIAGVPYAEIARRLNLKEATLATRFFRGRRALQKILAEAYGPAVAPTEGASPRPLLPLGTVRSIIPRRRSSNGNGDSGSAGCR